MPRRDDIRRNAPCRKLLRANSTRGSAAADRRPGPRTACLAGSLLPLFVAALPLLTSCEARNAPGPAKKAPHPNIIFILVDALRADRLGCYGHPGGLSPMMDQLAREGVLFEHAIAPCSWTLPSVASYFSGYYPTVHKVTQYRQARDPSHGPGGQIQRLGEKFTTLAEVLRAHGYVTAAFSANGFVVPKYGFAQGFDHFDASFAANTTHGNVVNAAAFRWLAQRGTARPFFLYLHYMDVHGPYKASDKYVDPLVAAAEATPDKRRLTEDEKTRHVGFFTKSGAAYRGSPRHTRLFDYAEYWQARYDAGVPQSNQYLNELRVKLDQMGLWDSAYVILTADHGESLGEHRLWAHGLSAHQDQLHVPLILRWPGKLPAGQRIRQTVRLFDIMPTLIEQLGMPPVAGIQAKSLVGVIKGQDTQPRVAFAEAVKKKPGQKALVLDEWKLLAHTNEGRYELYNLRDDPTEQHDLAQQLPRRVAELRRRLEQVMDENHALGEHTMVQHADVTPEELRQFQAVGYFGGDEEEDEPNEGTPDGP